jgi:adenine-specific DNA methylase
VPYKPSGIVVLDPTAGGGSIPFEALRLGHTVIANELNPVATTILHSTLDYPARFGPELGEEILHWGKFLLEKLDSELVDAFLGEGILPESEAQPLRALLGENSDLFDRFNKESVSTYLFLREVTCPHCNRVVPLLKNSWLSKKAGDEWAVGVIPQGTEVSFEIFPVKNGKGPRGQNADWSSVHRGVGTCIHCKQAIDANEIRLQARGESPHGTWRDRLYCVVASRLEPKLDKHGKPQYYTSGAIPLPTTFPDAALNLEREDEIRDAL